MPSPIGRIEIVGNGEAIVSLSIERDGSLPDDERPERSDPILDRAVAQLEEYFAGHRRDFDLPISLAGTAFQLAVWEQLVALDWGEVVSYGELGQSTGRPTAGRAVGGAVGANPIPIIGPSHACSAATDVSPATAAVRASRPRRGCSRTRASRTASRRLPGRLSTPDTDALFSLDAPAASSAA